LSNKKTRSKYFCCSAKRRLSNKQLNLVLISTVQSFVTPLAMRLVLVFTSLLTTRLYCTDLLFYCYSSFVESKCYCASSTGYVVLWTFIIFFLLLLS
jgi:hypothetical protein